MQEANIAFFYLGHFGTIDSIKKQILLIGKVIGEEENARALVTIVDAEIAALQQAIPSNTPPVRVLYYDTSGYIPGKRSNFNSMCEIIGVINVGAEQGIQSWSQIDHETLLKWNPDIIIVPDHSQLQEKLMSDPLLAHATAIKKGKVYSIPPPFMLINSQFMVLSANLLAGIVYGTKR